MNHTEDDLRAVLDAAAADVSDVEPVLARVRTGIARRRTRQRVVVVAAATGAAVLAAAAPGALSRYGAAGSSFGGAPGAKPSGPACDAPSIRVPADKSGPPATFKEPVDDPVNESPAVKAPPKPTGSFALRPKADGCPPPRLEDLCTAGGAGAAASARTGVRVECQEVRAGIKVPFRLGYLPAGTRPSLVFNTEDGTWVAITENGGWTATIGLSGDKDLPVPANGTIAGHPALLGDWAAQIDVGDCVFFVKGFEAHEQEARRVAEGLTPAASCTDRSTWFDASLLPGA